MAVLVSARKATCLRTLTRRKHSQTEHLFVSVTSVFLTRLPIMRCPRDDLVSLQISGLHDDCPLRRARLLNSWRKIHQDESRDQGRQDRSSRARLLHLECVYKTVECHWISNSARPLGGVVFVDLPPGRWHVSCCVFSSPMLLPTASSGHPVLSSSVVLFYFLPHLSNFFFASIYNSFVLYQEGPLSS